MKKIIFLISFFFLLSCNKSKDSDTVKLDLRWQSFSVNCDQVRYYLEQAYETDQDVRNSEDYAAMEAVDQINQNLLLSIFQCCGSNKIVEAGDKATMAAFLIAQHAPLDFQLQYIAIFKSWAQNGIIRPSMFVLMVDRIRMRQGLPQLYGTQVRSGEDGESKLYQVDNLEKVRARRDSLYMPPLEEYLNRFNVTLDSANYAY